VLEPQTGRRRHGVELLGRAPPDGPGPQSHPFTVDELHELTASCLRSDIGHGDRQHDPVGAQLAHGYAVATLVGLGHERLHHEAAAWCQPCRHRVDARLLVLGPTERAEERVDGGEHE
jgi:hypothetical protein